MGAELLGLTQLGMGIAQGISAYGQGQAQAGFLEADGIRLEREAAREATRIEEEGKRFSSRQKMAYIGSGVQIGGSAVVTLAQTDKWVKTEANAARDRGRAIRDYYGRSARIARREGIAGFISGITGGLSKGITAYNVAKAGI